MIAAAGVKPRAGDVEEIGERLSDPGPAVVLVGDRIDAEFGDEFSKSSGERVARTFQSACARQFGPPQTGTQTGRGSSRSTTSMISSEPGESLPSPTAVMP